jgi:hypothetical protein
MDENALQELKAKAERLDKLTQRSRERQMAYREKKLAQGKRGITFMLDATKVVAMAAGLAKLGAAMGVKLADKNAPIATGAVALVAQPASRLLPAKVPKGSMGAADRNLSAERRVCRGVGVMSGLSGVVRRKPRS